MSEVNFFKVKVESIYMLLGYFLLFSSLMQGQNQTNIWYFGNQAGLNFNNGFPTALSNGQLNTLEGCASICNTNGLLLFYTDGVKVWNKNHQLMPNGTGLFGNDSSSQSAIIVPKPGAANIYYIFTSAELANPHGICYSEVNMDMNAGLGDVTQKNMPLITPASEKITAVKKANDEDFWVVAHHYGDNSFKAYSVTNTGVNPNPVTSNVGTAISGNVNETIGYLKFSPDGSKLICCNFKDKVELFDFDDISGTISNPRTLFSDGANYGAEFSPSGNVAYITAGNTVSSYLLQYDLTSTNIADSQVMIYNAPEFDQLGALQLAKNGIIYLAIFNSDHLAAINSPEGLGEDCYFNANSISLGTGICRSGLPQYIPSFFNFGINCKNLCFGDDTIFRITGNQTIISVSWDFGDGNSSTDAIATHNYSQPGTYSVNANLLMANGSTVVKQKEIIIYESPIINNVVNDQILCGEPGDIYDLTQHNSIFLGSQDTAIFDVSYFISQNDAETHTNPLLGNISLVSGINLIYAKIYNKLNPKCSLISSFSIKLFQHPKTSTTKDYVLCDNYPYDNIEEFDLGSRTIDILNGQSSNLFSVSYYATEENANNGSMALNTTYSNSINPELIYVRIQNNENPECYIITSFTIYVSKYPTATIPKDLYECEEIVYSNKAVFNLEQQTSQILGALSNSDFGVSYYNSPGDALQHLNELDAYYENLTNPEIIYARLENKLNQNCYNLIQFQLFVINKPPIDMKDIFALCEGQSIQISAPSGFESYLWSTGEVSGSIYVTQPGNYSLTVTKNYGTITCENIKDINVVTSDVATVEDVKIDDWTSNNNTIYIVANGIGDYEYSINGKDYQQSPEFTNLEAGVYTVYIRDKNGCGITSEEIYLLNYPKFFTPNNDGINETWKIQFSQYEPKTEVYIFDRYGKLITSFNGLSTGWDGTYNNKPLPSTDYWFVVKRDDGREFKGHFTLLR